MFRPLIRYADFQGRSGRSEFWQFYLFIFLITTGCVTVGAIAENVVGPHANEVMFGCLSLIYLAIMIPWYAAMVRRLHDVDKSGWWLFAALIPFGIIALMIFWLRDGSIGDNRFGPDPKSRSTASVDPGEGEAARSL